MLKTKSDEQDSANYTSVTILWPTSVHGATTVLEIIQENQGQHNSPGHRVPKYRSVAFLARVSRVRSDMRLPLSQIRALPGCCADRGGTEIMPHFKRSTSAVAC